MRFLTLVLLLTTTLAFAQQRITPYFQLNAASHWIKNDGIPYRHAYSFRSGIGAGVKHDIPINNYFTLGYRLNYEQKGYDSRSNTLHYIGLDQMIQFIPLPRRLRNAYLTTGISNDRLVRESFSDPLVDHNGSNETLEPDFHKWSVGSFIGAGYWVDKLNLEAGINFDVAPSLVVKDELELRNYLWYFNVGFQVF